MREKASVRFDIDELYEKRTKSREKGELVGPGFARHDVNGYDIVYDIRFLIGVARGDLESFRYDLVEWLKTLPSSSPRVEIYSHII